MPARETEAIILKTFPLGEADRLVSFLGRSSGRVRGVASGARRLKNRYGSTLEILSHVQIWYVEKETRELVRIQQAELLESFHKAQSDYGLSTGLAVISEVDRADGLLDLATKLLHLLDGAARRLAAAIRSLLSVWNALWREAGFLRCSALRPFLREVPAPRNEISAPRGAKPGGTLYRRAPRSHRA